LDISYNVGTKIYSAPESRTLNPTYSHKSDLWSIGVTMYKIIFGLDEKDIRFENNRCYFQYDIGNDWRDLLSKILVIDENERMSESDFFNHRLLIQYDVQIQLQNLYTSKQIIEKDLENQTKEMEMLKDQLKKNHSI